MELSEALDYVRSKHQGVLVTLKRDGRPQLSNITYDLDAGGLVSVSITANRAKYANATRDPRVSLHVTAADFWSYVVLEGEAELLPVSSKPDDTTVDALVAYYRAIQGEHPDWDDYRAAMVKDQRTLLRFRPTHAYGMVPAR
jgi:PPOX class probable F420-dependent enzyme